MMLINSFFGRPNCILGINPATDPYFSDVVSLWHMDSSDDTVLTGNWGGSGYLEALLHEGATTAAFTYAVGNQFCEIGHSTINSALLTTNWTMEFFAKVESHAAIQTLLCKGADNGAGNDGYTELSIDILADGKIRYATYSGGTQASIASVVSTNPIEYDKWLHIAVVQQGTTTAIYVG